MNGNLVYLGIGTNLGDKYLNVFEAIKLISINKQISLQQISSIYQSSSWGFESTDFYNLVISIDTSLTPFELLSFLKEIEIKMGRTNKTLNNKYEARIIDIDILIFKDVEINSEILVLPHKEIAKRIFVINPLLELDAGILLKNNILRETSLNRLQELEIQVLPKKSIELKNAFFNQNHKKD